MTLGIYSRNFMQGKCVGSRKLGVSFNPRVSIRYPYELQAWRPHDRHRTSAGQSRHGLPRASEIILRSSVGSGASVTQGSVADELMSVVWPGTVVSPETVSQRVKLLRDALGDDPREPRYIGGLRGRGYQVVAAVEKIADSPATVAATEISLKSVAVLPFLDMSENQDQEYFADGLAEKRAYQPAEKDSGYARARADIVVLLQG